MKPLKYFNVAQNEQEWYNLRAGLVTSSKLNCIMANYGKAFGEPAKDYAVDIAIEKITGNPSDDGYSNSHMDRGHEQEPIARELYEDELFCDVDGGGFFCNDMVGCSPDGLVGKDGLIEIKSVIRKVHYKNVKRQSIDPAYRWQILANLMFTGREWIDFVSYCAGYPESKRLYVCRVYASDCAEQFEMIMARLSEFMELIGETRVMIENSDYFLK